MLGVEIDAKTGEFSYSVELEDFLRSIDWITGPGLTQKRLRDHKGEDTSLHPIGELPFDEATWGGSSGPGEAFFAPFP